MNSKPIDSARDSDLRGAWAALQRASATAERIALQTGTRLINVESTGAGESLGSSVSETGEFKK